MATGLAIMGFGGGAMVATPMKEGLLAFFSKAPQYLGPEATVGLVTENGHRFANLGGRMVEVVVAGAQQLKDVPFKADPGVYVVGTGNTGASATFFTLGVLYFCVMLLAALSFRTPAEGWAPTGWSPVKQQAKKFVTAANVHIDQALKTPQFWLMWLALCLNVTAGIAVIGIARTMMTEIFGTPLPDVVTPAFAATYVLMISLFNMLGRFFWASASDYIGRKTTFFIFFTLGTLLYLLVPSFAIAGSTSTSVFWLFAFYAATMIIFTMYGGGFSTIPAYLADIFGTRYVGGIHGRILTAWSTAGVVGPLLLTSLRQHSLGVALHKLASMVDPAVFQMKFGAPLAQLDQLIAANTVTVASLMEIVPAGTPNPTPFLYNSTMYTMVALLVVAFFCNWAIKPVARRHLMREPAGAQAEAT
jgi:hypothetical protein